MNDEQYQHRLLTAWEAAFHKGQFIFWILLSLKESAKSLEEIILFIKQHTNHVIRYDEQSVYRSLRKYQDIELVVLTNLCPNPKGPPKKYYTLTTTGKVLLVKFIERNIVIFQDSQFINLIKQDHAKV